jgi:ribonuclease VapC
LIVDSSAIIAILLGEQGWQVLRSAIFGSPRAIPAPVLTELRLVVPRHGQAVVDAAEALIAELSTSETEFAAFDKRHADLTAAARTQYGKGNGKGGLLNFGDLMVYSIAKQRGEPLLCTGRDFASTDLEIHPASRLEP